MVYHIYVTRIMYHNEIHGINIEVCIKINRMLSSCNKTRKRKILNKHFKVKIFWFLWAVGLMRNSFRYA